MSMYVWLQLKGHSRKADTQQQQAPAPAAAASDSTCSTHVLRPAHMQTPLNAPTLPYAQRAARTTRILKAHAPCAAHQPKTMPARPPTLTNAYTCCDHPATCLTYGECRTVPGLANRRQVLRAHIEAPLCCWPPFPAAHTLQHSCARCNALHKQHACMRAQAPKPRHQAQTTPAVHYSATRMTPANVSYMFLNPAHQRFANKGTCYRCSLQAARQQGPADRMLTSTLIAEAALALMVDNDQPLPVANNQNPFLSSTVCSACVLWSRCT
ncbi:hypothetical protein COO60DRAFT_1512093 [Scenedesmus sp. NREL 46B-D3]|nr:hypothetical protein COO60DRAFT_1512093 [Scenedesmus sp. NREL 46B-D3]